MNDNDKPIVGNKYSYKDTSNVIKVIIVKKISESGSRITVKDERGDEFDILKKEWKDKCEPLSSEGSKSEKHTRDSDSTFHENDIGGSKTGEVEDNPGPKKRIYLLLLALCVFLGLVVFVLSVTLVQSKKRYGEINNEYTTAIRDNRVLKDSINILLVDIVNLQHEDTIKQNTIDSLLNLDYYLLNKKLNNELYEANKLIGELQETIKSMDKTINKQNAWIIELEKQKPDCEVLNGISKENELKLKEFDDFMQQYEKDTKISSLESELTKKDNKIKELNETFFMQLNEKDAKISSLESELDNKEKRIKDMTTKIKNKDIEIETLTNIIKGKK